MAARRDRLRPTTSVTSSSFADFDLGITSRSRRCGFGRRACRRCDRDDALPFQLDKQSRQSRRSSALPDMLHDLTFATRKNALRARQTCGRDQQTSQIVRRPCARKSNLPKLGAILSNDVFCFASALEALMEQTTGSQTPSFDAISNSRSADSGASLESSETTASATERKAPSCRRSSSRFALERRRAYRAHAVFQPRRVPPLASQDTPHTSRV